jgi:hypothetical protein
MSALNLLRGLLVISNMVRFEFQKNRDSLFRATLSFAVLAVIVLVVMAEMPTGFCDDDCDGQCGTDCDCLSCLPLLPVVIEPVQELGLVDEPFSWSVPMAQYRCDLSPVSDIYHPPQLSA